MKKTLAFVFSLICVLNFLTFYMKENAVLVQAVENSTETNNKIFKGFEYKINENKTVSIVNYTENTADIEIPSVIEGKTVAEISEGAFENCNFLKSVTIPQSVKTIGKNALGYYNYNGNYVKDSSFLIISKDCTAAENYAKTNGFFCKVIHSHKFVKKSTVKPDCSHSGEILYFCSCGERKTEKISPYGHSYVKDKTFPPTEKSQGFTVYRCKNCGDMIKKDYVARIAKKTETATKKVQKISLKSAKLSISKISPRTYNGEQIRPRIKVTLNNKTLRRNKDYVLKYGKNLVGKGTVTITGKGDYSGSITKYFRINPRKTTAVLTRKDNKKILVNIKNKNEADGYEIKYSSYPTFEKSRIVTTKNTKAILNLKYKKTYYVKVRTVKTVGKSKYVSQWSGVKKSVVKK